MPCDGARAQNYRLVDALELAWAMPDMAFFLRRVKENTNKIVDDLSIARHRDRLRNLIEIRPYVSAGRSLRVNRRGPL